MEILIVMFACIIGIFWANFAIKIQRKVHGNRLLFATWLVNFVLWPICFLVFSFSKIVLKRDTLFKCKDC